MAAAYLMGAPFGRFVGKIRTPFLLHGQQTTAPGDLLRHRQINRDVAVVRGQLIHEHLKIGFDSNFYRYGTIIALPSDCLLAGTAQRQRSVSHSRWHGD